MSVISQFCRINYCAISGFKSIVHGRSTWNNSAQLCNYSRKTPEEVLGIDKPKRPLTPYFKFMTQMRPALLAKNPGISAKEAVEWTSKHWQQLDAETKLQMKKEYEKDREDYKKIKALYDASLSEKQKEEIKRVREEITAAREKRKLKAEYKELGRPKRPMSSYFLYTQTRKDLLDTNDLKGSHDKIKKEWIKLPPSEKSKFEKEAQILMDKYRKELQAWELKMISNGRSDLVRVKPLREKKQTSTSTDK